MARIGLGTLTPDPLNARAHTARNVDLIAASLAAVGPARPIVIDEHGVILAGNATQRAALQQGITHANVIDVDGETVVAVRVSGKTAQEKAWLGLADNRAAELATWQPDQIKGLIAQGFAPQVEQVWYPNELDALLNIQPTDLATAETAAGSTPTAGAHIPTEKAPTIRWRTERLAISDDDAKQADDALTLWKAAHRGWTGLMGQLLTRVLEQMPIPQAHDAVLDPSGPLGF